MNTNTEREELAETIGLQFEHPAGPGCQICTGVNQAADAILAAGYRKPGVLGYVVVARDGEVVTGTRYANREAAQAYADRWSADAKANRIDWDYRVAEIVEPTK